MPVAVVAIPGILAVIIILATALLVELVGRTVGASLPLPGLDVIGRWIANAAGTVLNAMADFLSSVARGIENLINVPVNAIRGIFQSISDALSRFAASIRYVLYTAIPQLYIAMDNLFFQAIDFTRALVVQFYNFAMDALANVESYLISLINAATNWLVGVVTQVYNALVAQVSAALQYALGYADSIYRTVTGFVSQVENYLLAEIQSAVSAVERYAQDLANWAVNTAFAAATAWAAEYANYAIGIAKRDLDAIIAGEMQNVWPSIIDNITGIAMSIPNGVQWVLDHLGTIEAAFPADIATALFDISVAVDIPLRWLRDCGMNLCENLGGFGDEMDNLTSELLTAAMIAFVVECVENPEPMAKYTDELAVEPLYEIFTEFGKLISAL